MPFARSLNWVRDRWLAVYGRRISRARNRLRNRTACAAVERLERRDLLAAPVLAINTGFSVVTAGTFTITNNQLLTTDADNSPDQLVYTLQSTPTNGTLQLTGINMVAGNNFTQQDINTGKLRYIQNGTTAAADSLGFTVSDGSTLQSTTRVSVSSVGGQGTGNSYVPSVSADGRYVAFASDANDLVPDDTNIFSDIFVKDRQTGAIELISRAADGTIANFNSYNPVISANGRYVAFVSNASNLVPGVSGLGNIFVKDRQTGQISVANVSSSGVLANQLESGFDVPAISSDGRYIAFKSGASNLVTNDTNGWADIFVHDMQTGQTTRVSVTSTGLQVSFAASQFQNPAISGDGRYVAFVGTANDLAPNDTNIFDDVFVHDMQTGVTTLVSLGTGGVAPGNTIFSNVAMSADGHRVAFVSSSSVLVPGNPNVINQVFVRDLQTGQTTLVSASSNGTPGNGSSGTNRPQLSSDGHYVLFDSVATNLVSGDTNGAPDLFLHDLQTGTTSRVSVDSNSSEVAAGYAVGAIPNQNASLSADGRVAVFASNSSGLVNNDTNNKTDIFARDSGVIRGTVPITILAPGNTPPVISNIADQTTNENTPTSALPFTVNDAQTPTASLIVYADSPNSVLLPPTAFLLSGAGANRTLTIIPVTNQSGTAIVTVHVTDLGGASTTTSFNLTVVPVNQPPRLGNISAYALNAGEQLRIVASATDPDPNEQLSFSVDNLPTGATIDANTGVFLWTPDATQAGTYNLSFRVTDNGVPSLSNAQVVRVSVNAPPAISTIGNQTIPEETSLGPIDFTVGDLETPVNGLFVLGSSSNTTLIPNSNIVVTGTGASRQVTITPTPFKTGTATITLRVFDGQTSTPTTFDVSVTPVNHPPTVQGLPQTSATVNEDGVLQIPITVDDFDTGPTSVTVIATSADQTLIPSANITVIGTGASRILQITPAIYHFGTTTIDVQASDGTVTADVGTFQLTVNFVNHPPTVSPIADQTTTDNTPTGAIAFTVGDIESDPATLTLSAITTNPTLVPLANIVFGGTGSNRTVTVTPAPNQVGSAVINVLVTDPQGGVALEPFVVNVLFSNDLPTITNIADQTVDENGSVGPIPFTVGDQETPVGSLAVSVNFTSVNNLPSPTAIVTGQGATRNLTLVPPKNVAGFYTVAVTVADGNGGTATDTFALAVSPAKNSLSITPVPDSTILEDTPLGPIDFQVANLASPGSFTLTATSSNTTLVPARNIAFGSSSNPAIPSLSTFTIQPAVSRFGTTDITITATAPNGDTASTTFHLTVQAVLDLTRFRRTYNSNADFHFFTTSLSEFNAVIAAGYRDETTKFSGFAVATEPVTGGQTVYRLYNLQRGFHYYTTSAAERDFLVGLVPPNSPDFGRIGWRYERDEGFMYATQVPGTVEIFRLYNPVTGEHLFTESVDQRNGVLALGTWVQHNRLGFAYPIAVGVANPPLVLAAHSGTAAAAVSAPVSAFAAQSERVEPKAPAASDLTQIAGRVAENRVSALAPRAAESRTTSDLQAPAASARPSRSISPRVTPTTADLDTMWMRLGPGLTHDMAQLWN